MSPWIEDRSPFLQGEQGEMSYEGSPVKAPPSTSRRMMPPAPQQISQSSTDESQASGSGGTTEYL